MTRVIYILYNLLCQFETLTKRTKQFQLLQTLLWIVYEEHAERRALLGELLKLAKDKSRWSRGGKKGGKKSTSPTP
jgi:hypothetical protein